MAATSRRGRSSVPGAPRTPGFSAGRARPGATATPWLAPQLRLYSAPLAPIAGPPPAGPSESGAAATGEDPAA